jgi:opacity protein-like surface antigen
MRSKITGAVVFVCLFAASVFADPNTQIRCQTTDLGSGRWQYTYDVYNLRLSEKVKEFTIWFGVSCYDNLSIETQDPPAGSWDQVVWQPEPFLGDDGGYDALAKNLGIGIGQNVSGFAVSFNWLGIGTPGSQFYEIIDPVDFHTVDSGFTVPEPATLLLFCLGGMILRKRVRRKSTKMN